MTELERLNLSESEHAALEIKSPPAAASSTSPPAEILAACISTAKAETAIPSVRGRELKETGSWL